MNDAKVAAVRRLALRRARHTLTKVFCTREQQQEIDAALALAEHVVETSAAAHAQVQDAIKRATPKDPPGQRDTSRLVTVVVQAGEDARDYVLRPGDFMTVAPHQPMPVLLGVLDITHTGSKGSDT